MPLIILFDSQNEHTHAYNLASIDILSMHGQMPESVIASIGFNQQNRYYYTSSSLLENDSLSGMKRIENFIFEELVPHLAKAYQAGGPVLLFGHSRTAFLVNVLAAQRYPQVQMVGSFSGFVEKGFEKSEQTALLDKVRRLGRPFYQYLSVGGDSLQEAVYARSLSAYRQLLEKQSSPEFGWHYQVNEGAGHLANYNLSLPLALTWYFKAYFELFNYWLDVQLKSPITPTWQQAFLSEFQSLEKVYGASLSPQLDHYISFANALLGQEKAAEAVPFLEKGRLVFPNDYDLLYYLAVGYEALHWVEKFNQLWFETKAMLINDQRLTPAMKEEIREAFTDLELAFKDKP